MRLAIGTVARRARRTSRAGEFTDQKQIEAQREISEQGFSRIYVYDRRLWDIKPAGTYGEARFRLHLGDNTRKPFILAAEDLMGIEAPQRAQWIRTALFEMARIANISLGIGDMGVQMGAITPVFFAFRDREHVLNQIEAATGGRFHPNYDRIGGLKEDLPKGWIAETKTVMAKMRSFCDQLDDLMMGNAIFQKRTRGTGVIPAEKALEYGMSGANLRASGVDWDVRRDTPSPLAYSKLDWKVWTHTDSDSFARLWAARRYR